MSYHHLNQNERYLIGHLHSYGRSIRQIAKELQRAPGTVSRELKRNQLPSFGTYHGPDAHRRAQRRRSEAHRLSCLDHGPLSQYVATRLRWRWSPQQIVGWLRRHYPNDVAMRISHETIYQWIYLQRQLGSDMYQCLRSGRAFRRKHLKNRGIRGRIPGRVGIEHRPEIVEDRQRFGDWESDTMQGTKGTGGLVTHVERRSRYLVAGLAKDGQAKTFNEATIRVFSSVPRVLRHTMTADNGSEFTQFKTLEQKLGVKVYFANPYSAWERGTNENTNGLLRQFFPKGMAFDRVTDEQVAKAVSLLNNRPRKCLGYRTPKEVLPRGVALQS